LFFNHFSCSGYGKRIGELKEISRQHFDKICYFGVVIITLFFKSYLGSAKNMVDISNGMRFVKTILAALLHQFKLVSDIKKRIVDRSGR
jgi:hypothetical protein